MKSDFGFARKPTWLLGHLIALVAIGLFINLGMWQLSRHEERSALDLRLAERISLEPLDIASAKAMAPADLSLRRVEARGVFDHALEVILQARSFNGRSGHNVLTPIVLADGTAIIVNRGWVPIDVEGPPVIGAEPPPGEVEIVGVARETEVRGGLGPTDPDSGTLQRISRVDLARLQEQLPYPVASFYLQLASPAPEELFPLLLDKPEPGGGPPHLSYAVQWFAFAGVVALGYPALLRSTARKNTNPT